MFTNIAPGSADVVRPSVDALLNVGFAVFAKPKLDENSDVDSDMLDHIAQRSADGLAALVVASATARLSGSHWRKSPAAGYRFRCSDFGTR